MSLVQVPDKDSLVGPAQWRVEQVARQCDGLHMLACDRLDQGTALFDLVRQRVWIEDFSGEVVVEIGPKRIDIGCRVDRPLVREAPERLAATDQPEIDDRQVGRHAPLPGFEKRSLLIRRLGFQRDQIDVLDLSPATICGERIGEFVFDVGNSQRAVSSRLPSMDA